MSYQGIRVFSQSELYGNYTAPATPAGYKFLSQSGNIFHFVKTWGPDDFEIARYGSLGLSEEAKAVIDARVKLKSDTEREVNNARKKKDSNAKTTFYIPPSEEEISQAKIILEQKEIKRIEQVRISEEKKKHLTCQQH